MKTTCSAREPWLYIDTMICLFPRKGRQVKIYVRKWLLSLKSGPLRNWKEKLMVVNVQLCTLSIYNDDLLEQ